MVLPMLGLFDRGSSRPCRADVDRCGIDVRSAANRPRCALVIAAVIDNAAGTKDHRTTCRTSSCRSTPGFVRTSRLAAAGDPNGYVEVDKYTLRHLRYPNVFALGDAANTPNAKTGAAVRKQAPVLVANLQSVMAGREPESHYNGYGSCPFVTARNRMLLAEFDYELQHTPSFPVIDLVKERYDMYLLKRYGLPFLYWNLMLRGLA
jgi:sulfide:quinone oxidoreductase